MARGATTAERTADLDATRRLAARRGVARRETEEARRAAGIVSRRFAL